MPESLRPGVTVNEVAERHGLKANDLSSSRTPARQGKLVLPEPDDAIEFAAMVVEMSAPDTPTCQGSTMTRTADSKGKTGPDAVVSCHA